MDINYFMKVQNAYGTKNRREKELVKVNSQMTKHFEDTYDTEDVLLNGEPFKLMIIKDTDGNTFKKKIKSPHGRKFNLGDYIEWNGQTWLVTLLDVDDRTWCRGYMYQCTILLRWQNENGEIIERYGWSEDFTKYTRGINSNGIITVGDFQYGLTLPVDNETKILKRDRRFPIDIDGIEPPDVYKLTNRKILLTDNRAIGRGGILTLTLSFSEFNPETDKPVTLPDGTQVWICDYIPASTLPSTPLPPSSPSDETTISKLMKIECSGLEIKPTGRPKTLKAVIYDPDTGDVVPNISYSWNVQSEISDFISYTSTNDILKISLSKEYSNFGDEIAITCSVYNGIHAGETCTIKLKTKGVF